MLLVLSSLFTFSQVGIGTTTPNPSSILELESTTQGLLITRITQVQRDAIVTPATGLLIFQTDNSPGFYYFDGATWLPFWGADNDWTINGTDMYNANGGNIGVGNNAPTTQFHITGSTVLPTGYINTLYTNDFSSGGVTSEAEGANTCSASPNIWHIMTTSIFANCNTCTDSRAYIQYGTCELDQTLVEGTFTPSTATINISFNYSYNDYIGPDDRFTVTLYDETNSVVISTLLNHDDADALGSSYSGVETVTAGNNYSLRFQYIGNDFGGAAVDDILVTENVITSSGSYAFRLEDGQQGIDKVLVSDTNGQATWKDISTVPNSNLTDQDWLGPGVSDNTNFIYHQGTASVGRDNAIDPGLHFQVQNGEAATGTKVGLGSIEVIEDLVAEFTFNYGILPKLDNFSDIGNATNRWKDLYLVNAPTVSSDMTLKNNVKSLQHGLNTLMKLKTFSYEWKNETIGDKTIPKNQKETHLGFSAQQLLDIMPEVVKTHSWKILDEATPNTFTRIKHNKLGVRYSEIIPVTVKAIQEQQNQIELLKTEIKELKEIINIISEKK